MRILFTRFPLESRFGGAEVQTMSLLRGLRARKHAVAFLGSCETLLKLCWDEGILAAELSIGDPPVTRWSAVSFLWRKKRMQQQLCNAVQEFGPVDAIVMLSLTEKLLLTPFARERGIRVYWMEHDGVGRWLTKNPWLPRLKELARFVITITVSEMSRDLYRKLGWPAERVVAIPNGVDLRRCELPTTGDQLPTQQDSGNSLGHTSILRIGTIARLTEDKGVDVLIEAVTDLPQVSLTIIGEGPEEGYLRKLMDERRLLDRVRIRPSVDDLGTFYASLDAFVLPSRSHDPFGLVAAEAMMLGIPTIVTDQCGIAGHLQAGQEALVVAADSAEELKSAIREMEQHDRRTALAHTGKRAARERFSLERMVDAYEKILTTER
ncbi:MAG: glycosyltransferase family 4 protein [Candidatus Peribacteraceae bacterium]|nr:glycosyltransferase family 4 protein [Candidatus Peribacteraceae bacterium]MDD5743039.1 glycosyltransferase family 4 protein [Candidatus Peribacteraceae bacterium]